MSDDIGPARTSQEIKTLLSRLNPKTSSHKDRVRRLNKFRNYIVGDGKRKGETPEFYDDDLPLLFLGSDAPDVFMDDDDDELFTDLSELHGLLRACGAPSTEHDNMLKRSARHAMALLKFLVIDYNEEKENPAEIAGIIPGTESKKKKKESLNMFAQAFCSLPIPYYAQHMNLELHVIGDLRGGAKDDACHVMTLLLTNHLSDAGTPQPMAIEELLPPKTTRQLYEAWIALNTTKDVQNQIEKNSVLRREELALQQRQDQLTKAQLSRISEERGDDNSSSSEDSSEGDDYYEDEGDVLAGFRRRKKARQKELEEAAQAGEIRAVQGPATRWEDSQLHREQKARMAAAKNKLKAAILQVHESVRDSQEAAAEAAEREEEKARILGKDPLGLMKDDFDLRTAEEKRVDILQKMMQRLNERIQDEEATLELEKHVAKSEKVPNLKLKHFQAQKESLETIISETMGNLVVQDGDNAGADGNKSILPTNSKFDPLLFLTLVHKEATYSELVGSMSRLSNKVENHAMQLQNLVLDNFPLFVRCADGMDLFNEKMSARDGPGMMQRLDKLDALAESCSHQARKSFKPLLDNTDEVRRVRSALAVLDRVTPILQAPYLMRQHMENGRFSEALKAYRRVLVVDEYASHIQLLRHAKLKAEERLRDARRELERRLAHDQLPVSSLLDGIRDLGELLELDIPEEDTEQQQQHQQHHSKQQQQQQRKPMELDAVVSCPKEGVFDIGGITINAREHPPGLTCFMMQAARFAWLVHSIVNETELTTRHIYDGDTMLVNGEDATTTTDDKKDDNNNTSPSKANNKNNNNNTQWKYDVLDARVLATMTAVELARTWMPRLLRLATASREEEKRRAARHRHKQQQKPEADAEANKQQLTAFEVLLTNVSPSLTLLVQHAACCALGANSASKANNNNTNGNEQETNNNGNNDLTVTFGQDAPEKLKTILRSPLPPSQSARVGSELAELVELLHTSSAACNALRPSETTFAAMTLSPLAECTSLGEAAVVTMEKRRCIYAFEVCARSCAARAQGSGRFDAHALLQCAQTLSEQLSHAEECAPEIAKGCELVVRRCCEGLAHYVRDRGDPARLKAVSECADVLLYKLPEILRELGYLNTTSMMLIVEPGSSSSLPIEQVLTDQITGLEAAMFEDFLQGVRQSVQSVCNVGWLDKEGMDSTYHSSNKLVEQVAVFPPYLSAALLAIVRCRAMVEPALGDKIRHSAMAAAEREAANNNNVKLNSRTFTYQHLAMSTAASAVVEGICNEVIRRKSKIRVRQGDRMANELQFLMNTLKTFLSPDTLKMVDKTRRWLCLKAGRDGGIQGDGPDGLAALEDLERLGRVYVLCLGE